MPRKGGVFKRDVVPDPKYVSFSLEIRQSVAKFINTIMREGKKSIAEKIVYGALSKAADRTKEDSIEVFEKALSNVRPRLEVKSRRVGGSTYQVPVDVRFDRAQALGMRWLVQSARSRGERTMIEKLAGEIVDAAGGRGGAVKKKEDTHRMAEANKAFAHFRW